MNKDQLIRQIDELILRHWRLKVAAATRWPELRKLVPESEIENLKNVEPVDEYAVWYDQSRRLIAALAGDRLSEFEALYLPNPKRAKMTVDNYTIRDFLQGIGFSGYRPEELGGLFSTKLELQVSILKAVRSHIDGKYDDLLSSLRFEFEREEIQAAKELFEDKQMRAAGTLRPVEIQDSI